MSETGSDTPPRQLAQEARDRVRFEEEALALADQVYRVARHLVGSKEEAEDLVQETYARAFRSWRSFTPGTNLRAWLLRIASNMACDHWRRTQRHPEESLDVLADEDEPHAASDLSSLVESGQEANPEEYVLSQELQGIIQRGLQALPLEQREAVVLCDIEGLSYEEIALTTQSNIGTVRSRIARGRARLRLYLDQYRELLPRNYRLPTNKE